MSGTTVVCQKKSHTVLVYSLSACVPCKEAKQFLREADIAFEEVEVDLCDKKERAKILKDIRDKGGNRSINRIAFPKIIIDDEIMITGFDRERIRELLMKY